MNQTHVNNINRTYHDNNNNRTAYMSFNNEGPPLMPSNATASSAADAFLDASAVTLAELNRQIAINDDVLTRLQQEVALNIATAEASERSFRAHRLMLQEEVVAVNTRVEELKRYYNDSHYGPSCVHIAAEVGVVNHRGTAMVPTNVVDALKSETEAKRKALAIAEAEVRDLAKIYIEGIRNNAAASAGNITGTTAAADSYAATNPLALDPIDVSNNKELQDALQLYIQSFLVGNNSPGKK